MPRKRSCSKELGELGELGELRELTDKRELIIIGYKAQGVPPKISSHPGWGQEIFIFVAVIIE
ncbi:MAG: hypothetical protein F6J92_40610 [Symploca sp. SIO1A3]|nr:hypothetical protein [Symploca sp. SIO1A3]